MAHDPVPGPDEVRSAELIATLCLATDLAMGFELEHGLQSTLLGMRLAERMGADDETARQTYYCGLLFYVGCTADAEISARLFDDGALATHFTPVAFGAPLETMRGITRALAGDARGPRGAVRAASALPRAVSGHRAHLAALCQVAQMLSAQLGVPADVQDLVTCVTERWDGKGGPRGLRGPEIPLPARLAHVARDATLHRHLVGADQALDVVQSRAGGAFDPAVVATLAGEPGLLASDEVSAWDELLAAEPTPCLVLDGTGVDTALAAMGDFADLVSPDLVGHSRGVAELAAVAARNSGWDEAAVTLVRRAGLVHDLGRVAVSAHVWNKPGALTADEWERARLHAYHSERLLSRSPFQAPLGMLAASHHERLDGSGYHRRAKAVDLDAPSRLLAAADALHTKIEPRPHRAALSVPEAVTEVSGQVSTGRLDAASVSAVVQALGQPAPRLERPDGLTEREVVVVGLLARGHQTKQVARLLGISVKTADRHIQNAYAKIGVSTRAAAAVYAMQHGLVLWGELPIADDRARS